VYVHIVYITMCTNAAFGEFASGSFAILRIKLSMHLHVLFGGWMETNKLSDTLKSLRGAKGKQNYHVLCSADLV